MKKLKKQTGILLSGLFGLVLLTSLAAGCSGPATLQPTLAVVEATATMPPTLAVIEATATIPPTLAALPSPTTFAPAFTPTTYTDDYAGFTVDYPVEWTLDQSGVGAKSQRGYSVQLTSWVHAPGDLSAQTPAGGSRMDITIYRWDPKYDLDAFISSRKTAWGASGFTIAAMDSWTLAGNQPAVRFLVQTPDEMAFFMMTTVGDLYLVLSGTGDLGMLEAIGRTTAVLR